jgi:hypothetical protein
MGYESVCKESHTTASQESYTAVFKESYSKITQKSNEDISRDNKGSEKPFPITYIISFVL